MGAFDGFAVMSSVGIFVGATDGNKVGCAEGVKDGASVGGPLSGIVGAVEGDNDARQHSSHGLSGKRMKLSRHSHV